MISPEDKIYRPLRLSRLDRALGLAPMILAIILGAAAVHLALLLALPAIWPASAYRTLATQTPPGAPLLAPRPGFDAQNRNEARDGGFADPFAALTICRFDLSRGPLRLRAAADGERPFSLSIRLIDGAIVYSSNDRQTPHGRFDVVILTQAQADAQDADAQDADAQDANAPNAAPPAANAMPQASEAQGGKSPAQEPSAPSGAGDEAGAEKSVALTAQPTAEAAPGETSSAEAADGADDKPDPPLRLIAPSPRGFALFRILARNEADYAAAAASRTAIHCALTPAP